jgi:hypothetical protein
VNRALTTSFRSRAPPAAARSAARFATAAEAGRALASAKGSPALRRLVSRGRPRLVTAIGLSIPAMSRHSGRQAAAQQASLDERSPRGHSRQANLAEGDLAAPPPPRSQPRHFNEIRFKFSAG